MCLFNDISVVMLTIGSVLSPLHRVFDFGGNVLFNSYLLPSHLANALILLGYVFVIKRRYRYGFAIFGIATCFHVVNGFWMAVVAGICVVTIECLQSLRSHEIGEAVKQVPWTAAGIYGAIALVGVLPLLVENFSTSTGFKSIYYMAWVRHPFHYVPSTWPLWQLVVTSGFIIFTTIFMWVFRHKIFDSTQSALFTFTWIITLQLIFLSGGIFTEVYPIPTIIKLQPFHVDGFLFVLLYGGLWKGGVHLFDRFIKNHTSSSSEVLTKIFILCLVGILIIAPIMGASFIVYDSPEYTSELSESYDWIAAETPENATFITSPTKASFRIGTSRAQVVDIKSFPFKPKAMIEWGERIKHVCGATSQLTSQDKLNCDRTYQNLSENTIRKIALRYDSCWVLSRNQTYSFDKRYSNEKYTIYHLQNSTHCQ